VELCIVGLCGWMSESDCRYESLSLYIYISVACVHAQSSCGQKNASERLFLVALNIIYCFFGALNWFIFVCLHLCAFAYRFECVCQWISADQTAEPPLPNSTTET